MIDIQVGQIVASRNAKRHAKRPLFRIDSIEYRNCSNPGTKQLHCDLCSLVGLVCVFSELGVLLGFKKTDSLISIMDYSIVSEVPKCYFALCKNNFAKLSDDWECPGCSVKNYG